MDRTYENNMPNDADIRLDPEVVRVYWEMEDLPEQHDYRKIYKSGLARCRKCDREAFPPFYAHATTGNDHICKHTNPIPLGVEALAFYMRDKCDQQLWHRAKVEVWQQQAGTGCAEFRDYASEWMSDQATPDQWIRVACKAYRKGQSK